MAKLYRNTRQRLARLHRRRAAGLAAPVAGGSGARYAQALFELAEQGQAAGVASVDADLKGLAKLRDESADFARLLSSPAFSHEEKGRAVLAIADAAQVTPLTKKFLGLLSAKGRVSALPAISTAFSRMAAARRGAVAAEVVSAVPLTEAQTAGVVAALRQSLGKDPDVTTRVDPSILGGLKVRVGSRLFDSSLKSRLDSMKFALKRA